MGRFDSKGAVALLAGILLVGWGQIVTLDHEKPQLIRYEFWGSDAAKPTHMQSVETPRANEKDCVSAAIPPPSVPDLPRNRKVSMLTLRRAI